MGTLYVTGFEPGTSVGKYVIERELGRGGMGVVYLAEDTTLARKIALKVLYASLSSDAVFVERFRQEAKIVAGILHPNVVRINSLETLNNQLAIDMEYVPGPSLGEALEHEVFTPQFAVQIARDVFEGLAVCHAHGVIHRDIKPNNVLLNPDGRAKLADFGLATAYARHLESTVYRTSSSGYFMGTPRFSPPEAWEGGEPTPDWDLYSFGLVLYEGLTGKPVYNGTTPLAIVKQMMTATVVSTEDAVPLVSKSFGALIDRLISSKSADRPQSAMEAIELLRAIPEYAQTVGKDSPTVRTFVHRVERRRGFARWKRIAERFARPLLGAVTMLAVGLGVGWYAMQNGPSETISVGAATPIVPLKTQDEVGKTRLVTVDELLALARTESGKASRSFQARYIKARQSDSPGATPGEFDARPDRWLLSPVSSGEYQLIGIAEQSVMVCRLQEQNEGAVALSGNWAGYSQPRASGLRAGVVSGEGFWVSRGSMNLSLIFEDGLDRSTQVISVSAVELPARGTDTAFVHAFEASPVLQPLVFHELATRYTWAQEIQELLPCISQARCATPIVGVTGDILLDGRLDEPAWKKTYYNSSGPIGLLPGRPTSFKAAMRVHVSSEQLRFGFEIPYAPRAEWGFRSIFMPLLPGRVDMQSRMTISRDFGHEQSTHQFVEGREIEWTSNWQMALAKLDSGVSVEILIPLEQIKKFVRADVGAVWRMNAMLVDLRAEGETAVVQWGYPDFPAAEHGVLLTFEHPLS
ncbi:MAG: serine/threonine-protein kinase [Candidatus Hydrogenedentes bacterium]|nr:serine/threonine-protein kinase [Candidatus Hydrogenedentota bacterium]